MEHRLGCCPQCQGRHARGACGPSTTGGGPAASAARRGDRASAVSMVVCSYCHAWREAPLDLCGQVLGQGRLGVGIASLVAHLRLVVRAPIRVIQAWLSSVHGLRLSVGEITDLLRRVAGQGPSPRCASASGPVRWCRPMRRAGEKTGRTAMSGSRGLPQGSSTSSTTRAERARSSTPGFGRTSRECWAATFMQATTLPQEDDISGAGRISCATCTTSKPTIPTRWKPSSGPKRSKGLPAGEGVAGRRRRAAAGLSGGAAADPRPRGAVCSR